MYIFFTNMETLRGLDTLRRYAAILLKGGSFCDFLFDFMHTKAV